MRSRNESGRAARAWLPVAVIGVVVLVLVAGLRLYPRLDGGQSTLDAVGPAYAGDQVKGARTGIDMIGNVVAMGDPIMTPQGGAAAEVPKLIGLVSTATGLPPQQVGATLAAKFPHTAGLLAAVPLSEVAREVPGVLAFVGNALHLDAAQTQAALASNFPHLAKALGLIVPVTRSWNAIPSIGAMSRFDGTPVRSATQAGAYFSQDLVGRVLEGQQGNYNDTASPWPPVSYFPVILTVLGVALLVFGVWMWRRASRAQVSARGGVIGWTAVTMVGVVVVGIVLGLRLYPRLGAANDLVGGVSPAFTQDRIAGTEAAAKLVSDGVDMLTPVVDDSGGAAAEVPALLNLVASKTGLTVPQVVAGLQQSFPHTAGLLGALPLTAVTAELPDLLGFVAGATHQSPAQLQAALQSAFPHLAQAITALPAVTAGWESVPGLTLHRFDGSAVHSVPQVRSYFVGDVVPVLGQQRENVDRLATYWPPINWFPPILTLLGLVIALYGAVMLRATRRGGPAVVQQGAPVGDGQLAAR